MNINGSLPVQHVSPTSSESSLVQAKAKPSRAEPSQSELDSTQKTTESSVSRTLTRGVQPSKEEFIRSKERSMDILISELPKKVDDVSKRFASLEKEIYEKVDISVDDEWDFSLDENGSPVILSDDLDYEQKSQIKIIISISGLIEDFKELQSLMIEALESDRTSALYSNGIGKYDLTEENFSDVINFREFMSDAQNDKGPTLAHKALGEQLIARGTEEYNKKYVEVDTFA